MPALAVIAKAPLPGRVKTRLSPPCAPEHAAALAAAALQDTLRTVRAVSAERHVLVLDGEPGPWLPGGFELLRQRAGDLGARLAGAFEDIAAPALVIGMDTPQVSAELLSDALSRLGEFDAVLGPATDGGYWAIGLAAQHAGIFDGVPMSTAQTAAVQLERLHSARLRVSLLPELRDFDTFADAQLVADEAPGGLFARTLTEAA